MTEQLIDSQAQQGSQNGAAGAASAAAAAASQQAQSGSAQDGSQNGAVQNGAAQNGQQQNGQQSIASGGQQQDQQQKPYWPEDWRERAAKQFAPNDEAKFKKELERLQKVTDPAEIYARYRNIENTWASNNFIKKPKDDATEAEIKEFHKALGVPEKAEDYTKDIKLENGAVIGELDKPVLDYYASVAHKAGYTPKQFQDLVNAYYSHQEEQASKLDESDENQRLESMRELKEEWGGAYKRYTNNIKTIFKNAPGGVNVEDPQSLGYALLNGRTADGRIIGNDPRIVRWLASLATEFNPAAAVVEDGADDASVDSEIEKIEKIMRTDRQEYNKKYADRYQKLLATREKIQARKRA